MPDEGDEYPPEIAKEFASLPSPRDPSYIDRLRSGSLEVLVRAYRSAVDANMKRRLAELVAERAVPDVRTSAARNAAPRQGEEDDVASEAVVRFWSMIQQKSFFEKRFNRAARMVALRVRASNWKGWRRNKRGRQIVPGHPGLDYDEPGAGDDEAEIADTRMLIREHLERLSEDHQRAVVLRYWEGLDVHSEQPDAVTVASSLKCSRRRAFRLLAEAKAILRARIIGGNDDDE